MKRSEMSVPLERLVRPRRETPKWIRLGRLLDEISGQSEVAISHGFVKGKTERLDVALARIEAAAAKARGLLRPNDQN